MKNIYLLITFLFLQCICPRAALSIDAPKQIRVAVLKNVDAIELSLRGNYRIKRVGTDAVIDQGNTFFNRQIKSIPRGISLAGKNFNAQAIQIIPAKEPAIYLDRRLYRGRLEIIKTKQGKLTAVNIIALEEYLKGVLYHEVSHRWPMETLKAQAIASRTYALYQAQENRHRHYHLYSDIGSQVYNGVYAERYRTDMAVDSTAGQVLVFKHKLLPAFFHSTCGGHTEGVSNLWKIDLDALSGTRCDYCRHSPYFSWSCAIDLESLEQALEKSGYRFDSIKGIDISKRNSSGRAEYVTIKGYGFSETLLAKDLRHIIGPSIIRSTNFNINIKGTKVYFNGKGWGHGVGMCQWGAFAMAKQKKTAKEILAYYYPGAKIVKLIS
jgi:stage II sporulation protein D